MYITRLLYLLKCVFQTVFPCKLKLKWTMHLICKFTFYHKNSRFHNVAKLKCVHSVVYKTMLFLVIPYIQLGVFHLVLLTIISIIYSIILNMINIIINMQTCYIYADINNYNTYLQLYCSSWSYHQEYHNGRNILKYCDITLGSYHWPLYPI